MMQKTLRWPNEERLNKRKMRLSQWSNQNRLKWQEIRWATGFLLNVVGFLLRYFIEQFSLSLLDVERSFSASLVAASECHRCARVSALQRRHSHLVFRSLAIAWMCYSRVLSVYNQFSFVRRGNRQLPSVRAVTQIKINWNFRCFHFSVCFRRFFYCFFFLYYSNFCFHLATMFRRSQMLKNATISMHIYSDADKK